MDIVERLKCYLASDSAVAEHGHEARLISKDALETAIAEIKRLRSELEEVTLAYNMEATTKWLRTSLSD